MDKINELINSISGGVKTYQKGLLFDEYFIPVAIAVGVIFLIMVIIIIRLQRANKPVRTCLKCGSQNPVSFKHCKNCGHRLGTPPTSEVATINQSKTETCPHCDKENPVEFNFCMHCEKQMTVTPSGAPLPPASLPPASAGSEAIVPAPSGQLAQTSTPSVSHDLEDEDDEYDPDDEFNTLFE